MSDRLENGSFESGWYHPGGVQSLQIPNAWAWWNADETTANPIDPNPWSVFVRPEVRVLSRELLPEHERALFILHGDQTLKIFKSRAWFGGLSQKLYLEPALYTLSVNIFGDLYKDFQDGHKIWANDTQGRDGRMRFVLNGHAYAWNTITPGEWTEFTMQFAADGETTLGVDVMCPYALKNSGIFADQWTLAKAPAGGQYFVNQYVVVLPLDTPRDQAHVLLDMLFDEVGG